MKKLYTLAALAFCSILGAQAADLKFWIGDTEIAPGQTITFSEVVREDLGGIVEVKMAPELFLSSDVATYVNITAQCTTGQYINMCAGGECVSLPTVTKTGIAIAANDHLPLIFDWMDYVDEMDSPIPVVKTNFTATDGSTQVKFTLVMDPTAASISLIETTEAVSYGPEGISYNVAAPSQLALYSITGSQVLSARVEGQGTISTHSLRPGLYIYTLRGSRKHTGKILVK